MRRHHAVELTTIPLRHYGLTQCPANLIPHEPIALNSTTGIALLAPNEITKMLVGTLELNSDLAIIHLEVYVGFPSLLACTTRHLTTRVQSKKLESPKDQILSFNVPDGLRRRGALVRVVSEKLHTIHARLENRP